MGKNKIDGLQILRGLAAISVILTHNWYDLGGFLSRKIGFNIFGAFGVDIFFILSGFIMSYTLSPSAIGGMRNTKNFLYKRSKRIYPIYIIALLPLIISALILKKATWFDALGNILLLPTFTGDKNYIMFLPQAWTLVYEMIFYCIFSVAILIAKKRYQVVAIVSAIIISLLLISHLALPPAPKLKWVNFGFIISDTLMLNFVIGALYGIIFKNIKIKINNKIIIALSTLAFIYGYSVYTITGYRFISLGLSSFIIVVLFSLLTARETTIYNKLIFLGNASYSIYLTHIYFRTIAVMFFKKLNFNSDIIGLAFTLIAITFGCVFYKVVEVRVNNFMKLGNKSEATLINQSNQ